MNEDLEVSCESVRDRLTTGEDLLLLDCREADEHATASVAAAVLLPMSELAARVSELEPHRQRPIVVMCHHGMRSAQVAAWLAGQGFASVKSMAGGIDAWAEQIDATVPRY
ncbi:MAG: rhodanese-like domain-containing protein [Planctomycetota bacterium]